MKKYIILTLIIIFGTASLSGYCTYKEINKELKQENIESVINNNVIENKEKKPDVQVEEKEIKETISEEKTIQKEAEIIVKKEVKQSTTVEGKKEQSNKGEPSNIIQKEKNKKDEIVKVEIPKKEIIKEEAPKEEVDNNYTEYEVSIAEKKECVGNNHFLEVGNSEKWFESKDEAVRTYKAEIKKWDDQWVANEISDEEYYRNCPYGYEVWNCPYCQKWTLNYYYD